MSLIFDSPPSLSSPERQGIRVALRCEEAAMLKPLLERATLPTSKAQSVRIHASRLAAAAREQLKSHRGIEALFDEYDLSSEEGVLLMCLAEALLRIPDTATQEALIRDKLARGHWDEHLGNPSLLVNASTWGLILTGRAITLADATGTSAPAVLKRFIARLGERVARLALAEAMNVLAQHFVAGADIADALRRHPPNGGQRYSYDCLGEAARGAADVERYFNAYRDAILAVAKHAPRSESPFTAEGISIKLSALHPRYEYGQYQRVLDELVPRLRELALLAKENGLLLTLDAEESERLELQLDIVERMLQDDALSNWNGFGLAVQAYQKRALPVLEWLKSVARATQRRIPLRLVKGAYWDSEIKRAQQLGLTSYPVYTRKPATDVSFLACAQFLLAHPQYFYPQFATHNAYSVAYLLEIGRGRDFEFQRLHGMGEALYDVFAQEAKVPVRVYAPIGSHVELLPYLVRRLLENGANTSFVNQLADKSLPIERLVIDPVERIRAVDSTPHPRIPLPRDLYLPERRNAYGFDLSDPNELAALDRSLIEACRPTWTAGPIINGDEKLGPEREIRNPAARDQVIGTVVEADAAAVAAAFDAAAQAQPEWDHTPAEMRAAALERGADAMEAQAADLIAVIIREGGRTVADAVSEVREAVDACRYYAARARTDFAEPLALPGPSGEANTLQLRGRGPFACISPWNFPVAIFTGQIAAALAAGNSVIAKPARQTPLAAACVVRLLHAAGIPDRVLHFLPGSAGVLGEPLLRDTRLAGVALTGSTETAWTMQQLLAQRRSAIVPFIAETGGQNVMIADSSALPEQLVPDAITSAFNSAGQRCSALRVLFVQEEIAERVLNLLAEAMEQLRIGDPMRLTTDIGPVIDDAARNSLDAHVTRLQSEARLVKTLSLPSGAENGSFFAPRVYEIDRLNRLKQEVFGPVLHVVRYQANALNQVIDAINDSGYGLTLGVHSRIESTWAEVRAKARAGNLYINRNMIGAVIGVQPFGGEGLSGTGPKAGGPHYLHRFATERTVTINTAAIGGNTGLLSLDE